MKTLKVSAITIGVFALIILAGFAQDAFKRDMEMYQAEGKCVSKLIAQQIERADIATGNGTCWIKK